ncbi:MAG: ORF6C domain-containing protein [Clostridium sp.]|uniref:ORF6C domain-containing protein n=1 Tax=Clostridium sp. TaxID=1506 RepID=UPI003F373025
MQIQVLDKRNILEQEVTTYGSIENPLFLAKSVADWIGHTHTTRMLETIELDEKLNGVVFHAGQNREMTFLTEDGLYEVLMQSRKPIAKEFKKRVKKLLKDLRLNRFNAYENLSPELKAIMVHDQKIQKVEKQIDTVQEDLVDLRDNAPLYNIECDELMKTVKRVATRTLGGYKTKAYKDKSIRSRVYTDIQQQIKRQFGLESYKAIKRCQLNKALEMIEDYKAPYVLEDDINMRNTQMSFSEV